MSTSFHVSRTSDIPLLRLRDSAKAMGSSKNLTSSMSARLEELPNNQMLPPRLLSPANSALTPTAIRSLATFKDLPDELIALSVQYAVGSSSDRLRQLRSLLLVCRRLANIVWSAPRIWAEVDLSTSMSQRSIKMVVRRSGTLNLDVMFTNGHCYPLIDTKYAGIIHALFSCRHRWDDVSFFISDATARYILAHYPRLTLSCTRALTIACAQSASYAWTSWISQNWAMPKLSRLSFSAHGPPPSLVSSKLLRECTLELRDCDISSVLFFLASTPILRRLELTDHGLYDSATSLLSNSELPRIVLPRLDYLALHLHTIDARALQRFLNALSCPCLDKLYLYADFDAPEFIAEDCTYAAYNEVAQFVRSPPSPVLRTFEFEVEPIPQCFPNDSLGDSDELYRPIKFFPGDIFWQLPSSIEKFTIHNVDFFDDSDYNYPEYTLPELDELIIRKSSAKLAFGEHFYSRLSDVLKRLGVKLNRFRLVMDDSEEDEDEIDEERKYVGDGEGESDNDGADKEVGEDEEKESRMEEVKAKAILRNAAVLY